MTKIIFIPNVEGINPVVKCCCGIINTIIVEFYNLRKGLMINEIYPRFCKVKLKKHETIPAGLYTRKTFYVYLHLFTYK